MKIQLSQRQILEYIILGIKNRQYQAAINLAQDCIDELDAQSKLIENQEDMPPEFNKVVDKMLDNEIRTCSVCHRTDQHEPWCSAGHGDVNPD